MVNRKGIFVVVACLAALMVTRAALAANPTPVQAQTCDPAGAAIPYGQSSHEIDWQGTTRHYRLYIPASYDPAQPVPLVLSLHGFASNPGQQEMFSQWNMVADVEGFIVAYPQGTGFPLRWNSGLFTEGTDGVDDVAFLSDLIDQLVDTYCLDGTRVYINGLSNGAGMSHRFACAMADRVAAFGGVAGAYNTFEGGCEPSRPVPAMLFHGTEDPIVPYGGNEGQGFSPIADFAADWAERNGCDPAAVVIDDLEGAVSGVRYTGCDEDANVVFYTIDGGGHTWPGGEAIPAFIAGTTSDDISASETMWAFFEQHALDEE